MVSRNGKLRINANGEVVREGNEGTTTTATSTSSVLSSSSTPMTSHNMDVFGFNLDIRQLIVGVCVIFLMVGTGGGKQPQPFL